MSKNRVTKHRVLVLDTCPVICEGLSTLLDQEADLSICWHGQSYRDALPHITTYQPDLVILGLQIDGIAVFDLIREIKNVDPSIPILVYGSYRGAVYTKLLLDIGVSAYVRKSEPTNVLLAAIRSVLKGELYGTSREKEEEPMRFGKQVGALRTPLTTLAKRELEVFRLIGAGKTSREIAMEMVLSVKTVETYRSTIRHKLFLRNNVDLIQVSFAWLHETMSY